MKLFLWGLQNHGRVLEIPEMIEWGDNIWNQRARLEAQACQVLFYDLG